MAILNKDEFLARLHERIGEDSSEESINFLEDMTDTYLDLEKKAADTTDWEEKYNKLDESWKARYRHRFFTAGDNMNAGERKDCGSNGDNDDGYDPEDITVNDLFN